MSTKQIWIVVLKDNADMNETVTRLKLIGFEETNRMDTLGCVTGLGDEDFDVRAKNIEGVQIVEKNKIYHTC